MNEQVNVRKLKFFRVSSFHSVDLKVNIVLYKVKMNYVQDGPKKSL